MSDLVVTKALASVQIGPDDSADGPGTFSLILSTDAIDRDGEVVETGAFNPLPDHISMDIDHGMSVATTVGSGVPFYNAAGQLQVDGTFASTELGQQVRTLVREGHVRTASVAMIPTVKTKAQDGNGPTRITQADLLNGAFTPVPSNTTARVLAAKSVAQLEALSVKVGARNSGTDQSLIQSIHDLAERLGAICTPNDGNVEDPAGDQPAGGSDGSVTAPARGVRSVTDAETKSTEDATQAADSSEGKSAADAAAVKAAADAADDLDAEHEAFLVATTAELLKAVAGL
jgi:hypothetical protein